METTRILSLAMTMAMGMIPSLQASVTEHQPPAPLPEFKTPEQLTKWRTETTAKTSAQEASRLSTPFYTGKPYLADSGSYAFKYREYNPEMGRWITVDPSGFPDGANNRMYAAVPTTQLDPLGLFNSSNYFTGISEITGGLVGVVGGAALILNSGETLGTTAILGALGEISGIFGISAGTANIVQAYTDTSIFIPSSVGQTVGYTLSMALGRTQAAAEAWGNAVGLLEDFLPTSGLSSTILTSAQSGLTRLNDAVATLQSMRALIPATKNGQIGYE
jgi:RHS repeat-associated protein